MLCPFSGCYRAGSIAGDLRCTFVKRLKRKRSALRNASSCVAQGKSEAVAYGPVGWCMSPLLSPANFLLGLKHPPYGPLLLKGGGLGWGWCARDIGAIPRAHHPHPNLPPFSGKEQRPEASALTSIIKQIPPHMHEMRVHRLLRRIRIPQLQRIDQRAMLVLVGTAALRRNALLFQHAPFGAFAYFVH
jgi:hypothetical protein